MIDKIESECMELMKKISENSKLLKHDNEEIARSIRHVLFDLSCGLHHASYDIDAIIRAAGEKNDK